MNKLKALLIGIICLFTSAVIFQPTPLNATLCIPGDQPVEVYLLCQNGECNKNTYTETVAEYSDKALGEGGNPCDSRRIRVGQNDKYLPFLRQYINQKDGSSTVLYHYSFMQCPQVKEPLDCLRLVNQETLEVKDPRAEFEKITTDLRNRESREIAKFKSKKTASIISVITRFAVVAIVLSILTALILKKRSLLLNFLALFLVWIAGNMYSIFDIDLVGFSEFKEVEMLESIIDPISRYLFGFELLFISVFTLYLLAVKFFRNMK